MNNTYTFENGTLHTNVAPNTPGYTNHICVPGRHVIAVGEPVHLLNGGLVCDLCMTSTHEGMQARERISAVLQTNIQRTQAQYQHAKALMMACNYAVPFGTAFDDAQLTKSMCSDIARNIDYIIDDIIEGVLNKTT